jgi:hypothetical protein
MTAPTAIILTTVSRAGTASHTPDACDATNGNSVTNGPTMTLEFTNTDTASHTVVIAQPGTRDGVASPGRSYTIPASTTIPVRVGYLPSSIYGNTVTFTANSAMVKVAAYQLAP